jgi:hypothetical protein
VADIRKLVPGQNLPGIPANDWNRFRAATLAVEASGLPLGSDSRRFAPGGLVLRVARVGTGSVLTARSVVGLGSVATSFPTSSGWPAEKSPLVNAAAPTDGGEFAVLSQDLGPAAGDIAEAVLQGVAIVKVDLTDLEHTHAVALAGDYDKLASASSGRARLLGPNATTGVQWRVVELGGGGGSGVATGRGVIADGDQAEWINASRVLRTEGVIKAWPFTTPPDWTNDSKYAIGDVVRLTAPAWSASTAYVVGDLVVESGTVYQCTTATGPDATLPLGDFASRGADGDWKRATATSSGTAASPATYDTSKWATEDARLWIDRYDLEGANAPSNFDTGTNYTAGKVALLSATAWSSSGTYALAAIVSNGGNVYRCTTATGPDATFPEGDFTLIGQAGTIWRAKVDTGTGAFDYREWRPVTPVVELRHGLSYKDVTVGSYVAWIGKEAVVMHCSPMEGWA